MSAPAGGHGELTRRAGLTFLTGILQQAARLVVGLTLTPIIIRGLGAELYGAWTMIQQTLGYLAIGDARPMGTLKFTLAVQQHVDDDQQKQRQVGAALIVWLLTLPVLVALGAVAVWAAPHYIRTDPSHRTAVRAALVIAVATLGADRVLSLPSNVLRGLNLEYRMLGWNGGLALLGGLLSAGAIWLGWGLVGLAWASLLTLALSAAVAYVVMRREVAWFGVRRPGRAEIRRYTRLGGWLIVGALGLLLLTASDLLAVGIVLGPAAAAVYAATGAVLRMVVEPIMMMLSSGNAGIAGLCGRGEFERVRRLHLEMRAVGTVMMTIVGSCVVLLNSTFLSLWVGPGLFAGHATNLLLVLAAMQTVLFRVDAVLLDGFMELRAKGVAALVSGLAGLALGMALARSFGLPGMAFGTVLGRLGLTFYLPKVIRRRAQAVGPTRDILGRSLATGSGLLAIAAWMAPHLAVHSWLVFTCVALLTGVLVTLVAVPAGLDPRTRTVLFARLTGIWRARAALT